jgi:Na+-transporting NADH:ubiquinone oxidoreductase subunit B
MLRRFFDFQYKMTEKGKPLEAFRPIVVSLETFIFEAKDNTKTAPHIRDAVDVKRWMMLVVIALLPCMLMAIWNTGLQDFVYSSGDYRLMDEYLASLTSFSSYFSFAFKEGRWIEILKLGALAFLPVVIISYLVGGLVEAIFAVIRGHELAEGFLVTGILYPLVLPPTIPYWMVAVGVAAGVFLAKEVFGGTGQNIMNPALACRAFLFFTFPGRMTGDVWVGTNPTTVRESLIKMNTEAGKSGVDAYSQASPLMRVNVSHDIKRIHVDAIASQELGNQVSTYPALEKQFGAWKGAGHEGALGALSPDQLKAFVTTPTAENGLGLSSGSFDNAWHLADVSYGLTPLHSDGSFFFGNKVGCMGETSALAALLGGIFLVVTGIGSWRTMVACFLGAFLSATLLYWGATYLGADGGAWNPASYAFPPYKQLIVGGLAFGYVFMATDPVSSPSTKLGQWIYGLLVGLVTITIRLVNPAYPEGVMLAIIMGNVFAPLIDHYAVLMERRRARVLA